VKVVVMVANEGCVVGTRFWYGGNETILVEEVVGAVACG